MILILSADATGAALLGALVETLGYSVAFARARESGDESLRRVRPKVCLVDCADRSRYNDEFLGRTAMRGIAVVIFGSSEALSQIRALALVHDLDTILVPPDTAALADALERAMAGAR
jgi:CheY-like chemotaxis protein